jgi:phosphatidate cytidylyltransferase
MTRVISGVVLAAVTVGAIVFLPPTALRVVVCIVAVLAAHEYLRLVGADDGYLAVVVVVAWTVSSGAVTALALSPVVVLVVAGFGGVFKRRTGQQAILGNFAALYIGVPLGMLAALHNQAGWRATLLLIATVVVSDSLQFYSGRLFGRRALAPAISPKKTIEGAMGGLVAGTLFLTLVGPAIVPERQWFEFAIVGLIIVILGIVGDLFESRLKREANVKDSSALIPGHGGVLDRIDALLFVIPVFALYMGVFL